jgi:hypothetical protein
MKVDVFKITQNSPTDIFNLAALIQLQTLDPATIVAIMSKTDSNSKFGTILRHSRDRTFS